MPDILDFFWELSQQGRINDLERRANDAECKVLNERVSNTDLESRLGRLTLINQAMWELLSAKLGVTGAELEEKMKEIDLRDGVQDGRITPPSARASCRCEKCGRTQNIRNRRCVFCNELIPSPPLYQAPI